MNPNNIIENKDADKENYHQKIISNFLALLV